MKPELLKSTVKKALEEQNLDLLIHLQKDLIAYDKQMLDDMCITHILTMAANPNIMALQQFIMFAINSAERNLVGTHMPAYLIYHLFEMISLDQCKQMFALLEANISTWNKFLPCNKILLRLCNNLLERVSKVQDASFRGRILIFLSTVLPYYDRSGCNVDNECNLECLPVKSESYLHTENDSDTDLDHFKILQKYLNDPVQCINEEHWDKFDMAITAVIQFIKNNEVKDEKSVPEKHVGKTEFTISYLRTRVFTSKFRREILLQTLMIFQYLETIVLQQERLEWIKTNTLEIYSILEKTPPDGLKFVNGIKKMLEREKQWSAWKSAGCPERPAPASMRFNLPEKRYLGDILKESMATNSPPTTVRLEDCKSKNRNFLPKLTEYLREAAEELAPESTVAEENKKIYNSPFGWKAIRLMANRSNKFFDYRKDPLSKTEFLKTMIIKVLDAERDTVQVTATELEDEARGPSTIQVPISTAEFESLFGTLGDDWMLLAEKLGFTHAEMESVEMSLPTPLKRASTILRSWFEGPMNPSIEYFCTMMSNIGHPEISELIKARYLMEANQNIVDQSQDTTRTHDDGTDVMKTTPELVDNSDVQDTINSPASVNIISDDDKPGKPESPHSVSDETKSEIESMMAKMSLETITSPESASFQNDLL